MTAQEINRMAETRRQWLAAYVRNLASEDWALGLVDLQKMRDEIYDGRASAKTAEYVTKLGVR